MVVSERLIARYAELKMEAPDCLLLMQVGSFMQVMGDPSEARDLLNQALVAEVFNFGDAALESGAAEDAIFGHKHTDRRAAFTPGTDRGSR